MDQWIYTERIKTVVEGIGPEASDLLQIPERENQADEQQRRLDDAQRRLDDL